MNPLKDQLRVLEHLQELDLKIDQIQKRKEALPVALHETEANCNRAKKLCTEKLVQLEAFEKSHRQVVAALEMNQERMERASKKLDGVKTGHEFQAATKEVDQLKKFQTSLEEQSTKTKDEHTKLLTDVEAEKSALTEIESSRDKQAGELSTQDGVLNADINQLLEERKLFISKIDPQTLSIYDRVRKKRAGLGIVPAIAGQCKGCNILLPPQLFNLIQKQQEVSFCPSCQRILYTPAEPEKTAVAS